MQENKFLIPLAVVVAGALVAGAVMFRDKTPKTDTPTEVPVVVEPVTASDRIVGNPNAPIIIVEYSDTECPFCKTFQQTMHRLLDTYGPLGQVAWVYRHAPIVQLHPKAFKEAEAVECAAEQGGNAMFWKYLDKVYEITPSNNNLDPAELTKTAEGFGLDMPTFNTCLESGKYTEAVQKSVDAAIKATNGQLGTPFSVILLPDGTTLPIRGAQSLDVLEQTIKTLLLSVETTTQATTTPTN
jgi:protein-disulfide isomerase